MLGVFIYNCQGYPSLLTGWGYLFWVKWAHVAGEGTRLHPFFFSEGQPRDLLRRGSSRAREESSGETSWPTTKAMGNVFQSWACHRSANSFLGGRRHCCLSLYVPCCCSGTMSIIQCFRMNKQVPLHGWSWSQAFKILKAFLKIKDT